VAYNIVNVQTSGECDTLVNLGLFELRLALLFDQSVSKCTNVNNLVTGNNLSCNQALEGLYTPRGINK